MNEARVAAEDERRHASGDEPLWNESWYFDLVDRDRSIGAYLRLGLYPNRSQTWLQMAVARRGAPLVSFVDLAAPMPSGPELEVAGNGWTGSFRPEVALESWHVALTADGHSLADPLDIYRSVQGSPIGIATDLTWTTTGEPYPYGVSTRYEVSCRVAGTLRVGDQMFEIDCAGQRDHSWGVRDWWAFGWCWSAGALDDGTVFHAADIRFAGGSAGFGYVQRPGEPQVRTNEVVITEQLDAAGIPLAAQISLGPDLLSVEVTPVAVSPVLFEGDDGRTARMPRLVCEYRTPDGRTGSGWTEWNQLPTPT